MRFTRTLATSWAALLVGCGVAPGTPPRPATVAAPAAQPGSVAGAQPAPVAGVQPGSAALAPARSWDEYKLRAARRIHDTSAGETFTGPLPDPLQSIPVLQIQLNRDGSVRNINVLRVPRQSAQTLDMAMRAIRRAGPFGPVGHLPQPWQFSETFLYNDELKFQLRTLAEVP